MGKFLRWLLWSAVMALGGWVVLKLLRTTAREGTALPPARAIKEDVTQEIADVTSSSESIPVPSNKPAPSKEEHVNLNEASQDELANLRGVGTVLAGRIVAARPFDAITDLTRVSGIGKAKLEELKGSVTL